MFQKQSVFLKSKASPKTNFTMLDNSSDSEKERENVQQFDKNIDSQKKQNTSFVKTRAHADEGWEDVRNTKHHSNKQRHIKKPPDDKRQNSSVQERYGNQTNRKPYGKKSFTKKDNSTGIHDKQARSTVHNAIKHFCDGDSLDNVALAFKNAIDTEVSHYAKGKLLEVATSHLFHELLSHPLIYPYFNESNVREGDGHNALFWVAWSEYRKYKTRFAEEFASGKITENPLEKFERTLDDALVTIDLLFDVGYTSTSKNRHGETAVKSLEIARNEGKIDIEWYEPIKNKYVNISSKTAEVTLREICGRISTDQKMLEKYRTLYCLGFYKAPNFASQLVVEFCVKLDPSCIGRGILWDPICEKINMFKSMISTFDIATENTNPSQDYVDFADAFVGWKRDEQLMLFNKFVTKSTLELLEKVEQVKLLKLLPENASKKNWEYDTCFTDPLAGVIGECGTHVQKKNFILQKLSSVDTMIFGLYCISHGKFIDSDIKRALYRICLQSDFETNTRLKFALYDVLERVCKQKIKNLEQCKTFLQSETEHHMNQTLSNDVKNECSQDDEIVQLDEKFCEQLKSFATRIFDGNDLNINNYVEELQRLISLATTNKDVLLESFIARSFYDVYNRTRINCFSKLIEECKKKNVFDKSNINSAISKMENVELENFFESNFLGEVQTLIHTL